MPFVVLAFGAVTATHAEQLRITGATDAQATNIRLLSAMSELDCKAPNWLVRYRYERLGGEVERALQGLGFYQAEHSATLVFGETCWSVELSVTPGEALTLRNADVRVRGDAADDPTVMAVTAQATPEPGQAFSHAAYRELKRRLASVAADRGYFNGEFVESKIDVYIDDNVADIQLVYESGRRYVFGELTLDQSLLDDDLVRRFARWEPGAPYRAVELSELNDRLRGSGYFDSVVIEPRIPDSYGPVDVHARLTGSGSASYSVGGGYSTDVGPRGRAGYEDRRVNSAGHQLSGDLTASPVRSELSATYRRPLGDPAVEWLSYTLGIADEDTDTSESQSLTFGLRRVLRLSNGWLRANTVELDVSDFTVGAVEDRSRLLMPGISFSRQNSDDSINPSRGYRVAFEARGTAEALGSSTQFAQLIADGKWIYSFNDKTRLLARGTFGVTFERDFEELPPSVRFFAGGNESVRGFDFETLGPTDADGIVIGGSQLITASLEIDRTVYRSFALAAFVDAGNAFDGTEIEARIAAGIGVKWRSPVGPLRLYLAKPLNFDERDLRLHISFGPDL
ncbi:MAG: autotransporter assembly complex family protein [Pseudomonadota bacterium]